MNMPAVNGAANLNPSHLGGHLDVLGSIPRAQRKAVLEQCTRHDFERADTLWTQGDQGGYLAFLIRGKAMSSYHSPGGKAGITGFWSDGDILGAADLGGSERRQMTVQFLAASTVYTLPLVSFYAMLEQYPELARQIVRALSVRLRWVARLALGLATHSTEDRVRGLLLARAASFGIDDEQGLSIDLRLSHEDLASMVGVSRQFVNGALNNFKHAGYIRIGNRKIVITDLQGLQDAVFKG